MAYVVMVHATFDNQAAVADPTDGGLTPGLVNGVGWCAWHGEVNGIPLVVVSTPEPVAGVPSVDPLVSEVLTAANYTGKPFGRIGGS